MHVMSPLRVQYGRQGRQGEASIYIVHAACEGPGMCEYGKAGGNSGKNEGFLVFRLAHIIDDGVR